MNSPKIYSAFICEGCRKTFSFDIGIAYEDLPETYMLTEIGKTERILVGYGLRPASQHAPPVCKCVQCEDHAKYQRGMKAIKRWEGTIAGA